MIKAKLNDGREVECGTIEEYKAIMEFEKNIPSIQKKNEIKPIEDKKNFYNKKKKLSRKI